MNVARSTAYLTAVRSVNQVLGFASLALFTQALGVTTMGSYFLFHTVVAVSTTVTGAGINGAVKKRLSGGEKPSAVLGTGAVIKSVPLVAIGVTVLLGRGFITDYVGADLAVLIVVATFFDEYSALFKQTVAGELAVDKTAIVQLAKQVTYAAVGLSLVALGYGVRAPAYGLTAGYVAQLLVANYYRETRVGRPTVEQARSLWAYARHNYVTSLGTFTHQWMDVLILGFFVSQSAVAAYEIAWRVSSVLLVVTQAFAANVVPQVSSWDADGQRDRIGRFVGTGLLVTLAFVVPGIVGAGLLSEEILRFVFGEGLQAGTIALVILAGGRAFETVADLLGRLVMGLDVPEVGARMSVVMLVSNVICNLALVPVFGIVGAAVGTVVSFAAGTVLIYRSATELVTVSVPGRHLGYVVAATAGMAGVLVAVRSVLPVTSLIRLSGHVLLGVVCYGGALLLIRPLRRRLTAGVRELAAGV